MSVIYFCLYYLKFQILKVLLKKFSHQVTETDLATIANNAHGYVGADLAALVNEGVLFTFIFLMLKVSFL